MRLMMTYECCHWRYDTVWTRCPAGAVLFWLPAAPGREWAWWPPPTPAWPPAPTCITSSTPSVMSRWESWPDHTEISGSSFHTSNDLQIGNKVEEIGLRGIVFKKLRIVDSCFLPLGLWGVSADDMTNELAYNYDNITGHRPNYRRSWLLLLLH